MEFLNAMGSLNEISPNTVKNNSFEADALKKYDAVMEDTETSETDSHEKSSLSQKEIDNKYQSLFEKGDFFSEDIVKSKQISEYTQGAINTESDTKEQLLNQEGETNQEPDYSEKREPNSTYEFNGNTFETDDNGQTYKKNGEILPNIEYTVNGNTYKTDENGNKVSCDSNPKYTGEGSRNMKEQKESGGDERQEDDDGGHIIARVLGGAEGEENLVPMRRTINRGDYKRMENEISKALQDGKKVSMHIDIEYDGDSSRPSKLRVEYTIDDKKTVCEFDNVDGSTDLMESLIDKISDDDYERLDQMLKEMKEDGCDAAITSVKVEYDENGNPTKVTVGILDESTSTKSYKEYEHR